MSTSPAEQPDPGLVTFTPQGDHALDRLAADLVDHCDGSTASIADVLEKVLSADIAELADKLGESLISGETGPAPESPDEAARRRLGVDRPTAADAPPPPPRTGR